MNDAMQPYVTVVLPCLNEAASIADCVSTALTGLDDAGCRGEVLVVDNGSDDDSAELATSAGARVVVEATRGYGAALRAGIAAAKGDFVVMADADGTYDLRNVGALLEPVLTDRVDLSLGSRMEGLDRSAMPLLHRFLGTPIISFLLRRAAPGLSVRDSQSGYRAARTSTLRNLNLKATGMEFASEMIIRASEAGLRVGETPLRYSERVGDSKLQTMPDGWRHLQLITLLAPHLVLFWPGILLLTLGALLAGFSLVDPEGLLLGSSAWQPIYLAPILIVLGVIASVAGAVLGHHSSLGTASTRTLFRFVGSPRFSTRLVTGGLASFALGLIMEIALFVAWLGGAEDASRRLVVAGLAQTLLLAGSVIALFGLVYRVVLLRGAYHSSETGFDIRARDSSGKS